MKSIVLVSGGLDSAVALALTRADAPHTEVVYALSFDYGQRHVIELESALKVATDIDHFVVKLDGLMGGSSLTDTKRSVPKAVPKAGASSGIPSTYVPARNTVFIAHALHYAEKLGCWRIVIGANALDYSGYPDCRPDYIAAWNALAKLATKPGADIQIEAPLINMTKAEIIREGVRLGVRFEDTHSCYDPVLTAGGARACGRCDSCRIRRDGFKAAGVLDPTSYWIPPPGHTAYVVPKRYVP